MTIASEISRLQTDKECMRQAIIGKGVDVCASVSLDDYAACINSIKSGGGYKPIDILVVGGGGGGRVVDSSKGGGVGGGGGAVIFDTVFLSECATITVGCGGACGNPSNGAGGGGSSIVDTDLNNSTYGYKSANGGCGATSGNYAGNSGTGCQGSFSYQGYGGAGGGGACGNGQGGNISGMGARSVGRGGAGLCGYGIGGGGCKTYCGNQAANSHCGQSCGGGGEPYTDFNGVAGVVDICYPSDGSYGFSTATGGNSCYTCDGYCVHRFTSDGTFTIVS